jgi:hypothetical protein
VSRPRASVSNIVIALLLLSVGVAWGQSGNGPMQVITVTDTLAGQEYALRLQRERLRTTGLRARLEGIESRPPTTIFVTDTLTTIPDTVLVFVNVRDGVVTAEFLVATDELPTNGTTPTDELLRPELHTGSDISDCDEGFEVSANGVQCDRARLGHLYAYAEASRTPSLGVYWEPSFRSPWTLSAGHTGSEWVFTLRRGWRLF